MRVSVLLMLVALTLLSCKKDRLEGDFEVLQGKWRWIGSTETRKNKVSGDETFNWIPASDYATNYFIEFEHKGKLSLWENESEVKFYRIETVRSNQDCDNFKNCEYRSIHLNFEPTDFMRCFINEDEDTMDLFSVKAHVPLRYYQDNVAEYFYLHRFERTN